jgi:uncharacterized membrane protein
VELNDWILALHLLAAFCLIGALVIFSVMIVALWRCDSPSRVASTMSLARLGAVTTAVGSLGTVIFGVWLAISLDRYEIWDGWVIAALILWAIASSLGQKSGVGYTEGGELAQKLASEGATSSPELAERFGATRAFWLHVAATALFLLILVDMIWKPGA